MYNNIFSLVENLMAQRNLKRQGHNYALNKFSLDVEYVNRKPTKSVDCERVNMLTTNYGDRENNVGAYYAKFAYEDRYIVIPQGTKRINRDFGTLHCTTPIYFDKVEDAAEYAVDLYTKLVKLVGEQ